MPRCSWYTASRYDGFGVVAYDVVIVGGGPAGLSAALILGRARRSVLVCDDGHPRNASVEKMHGFLSRDGTSPKDLRCSQKRSFRDIHPSSLRESTSSTCVKRIRVSSSPRNRELGSSAGDCFWRPACLTIFRQWTAWRSAGGTPPSTVLFAMAGKCGIADLRRTRADAKRWGWRKSFAAGATLWSCAPNRMI